jgi:hypothetical protein
MSRKTRATPAGVARNRSGKTRYQRRLAAFLDRGGDPRGTASLLFHWIPGTECFKVAWKPLPVRKFA